MTGLERVTHMSCRRPTCDGVVASALRADGSLPAPPTFDNQALISDGTCSTPPRKAIQLETEPHVRWEGGKQSQGGMTGFERVTHMSCLRPTCDGVVAPALRADGSLPTPPILDDQATRRDDVTIPPPHLSSDQGHTVRVDQTCTQQAGGAANPRQSLTQESVMSITSSDEEEDKRKELEGEGVAPDLLKLSHFIFD